MKSYIAILLVFILGCSTISAQSKADAAADILIELVREAQASLNELDQYWDINFPLIKGIMDTQQQEFNELEQECFDRKDAIGDTEQDIETARHYIEWIGQRIEQNQERIRVLEDKHCDTSKLYVNGLKHNKLTLSLIEFMRKAISEKDELSLVQKKAIFGQLSVFFQMYSIYDVKALELLQQEINEDQYSVNTNTEEKARTDEEIGQGHVDNKREQIDVDKFESSERRSWSDYKSELLELLDTLEEELKQNMQDAQNDQIAAGVSLADFKIQLEKEIQELDRHLAAEAERITRLQAKTVRQEAYYRECIDEINLIFEALLIARKEYDDKIDQHNSKRAQLANEVQLFEYVEAMYRQNVNADGDYEEREVDTFSILSD